MTRPMLGIGFPKHGTFQKYTIRVHGKKVRGKLMKRLIQDIKLRFRGGTRKE